MKGSHTMSNNYIPMYEKTVNCTSANWHAIGVTPRFVPEQIWANKVSVSWHISPVSASSYISIQLIGKKKKKETAATAFNLCAAICVQQAAEYYRILHILCSCTEAWLSHLHHPYISQPTAMSKTENQREPWLKPKEQRSAKGYRNKLLVVLGYDY